MSWATEHGADFDVPAQVIAVPGIVDLSWHNDVCPRFTFTSDGSGPNLWVDHPNPDEREYGPGRARFLVKVQVDEIESSDDYDAYEGDDLAEAIRVLQAQLVVWQSRN